MNPPPDTDEAPTPLPSDPSDETAGEASSPPSEGPPDTDGDLAPRPFAASGESPGEASAPPGEGPILNRTITPVAGRLFGGTASRALSLAALTAGCAVFFFASGRHPSKPAKAPLEPVAQVVAFQPLRPKAPATPAPTLANPGSGAPVLDPLAASSTDNPAGPASPASAANPPAGTNPAGVALAGAVSPGAGGAASVNARAAVAAQAERAKAVETIRAAPILAFASGQGAPPPVQPAGFGGADGEARAPVLLAAASPAGGGELDQLRQASSLGLVRAGRLPDRNFLIAAGTLIPCTLMTAMDNATPGYVSCLISQDVYSDNGAVVLLERGSKVLGEYHLGLHQGQSRLFVLWTRIATPSGVAVALASPASDALGRAGFDGAIDTHFWRRFGAALLFSVVDDASEAAIQHGSGLGMTLRMPSQAASIALQDSVNIPPSLKKPQGAEVGIFVANDLDFSAVYAVRAR